MTIKVEALDHITANVTDVARAKLFYGGLLNLVEVPRPSSFDFPGAWYQTGSALIHVVGRKERDPETTQHFCLFVSDVKEAQRAIAAAGFEAKWDSRKIPGIERFFTRDLDGNLIEIWGSDGHIPLDG
jgi:glyoxylase I family protein